MNKKLTQPVDNRKDDGPHFLLAATIIIGRILHMLSASLLVKLAPVRVQRLLHELYALVWFGFLLFVSVLGFSSARWVFYLAVYRILDIIGYRLYFIFYKSQFRPWSSLHLRETLIYAVVNSSELVIAFGILYLYSGAIGDQHGTVVTNYIDAIYFSATTMLTVGFGDFFPISHFGRILVLFEYLCMVVFLLFMLPLVLSVLSARLVQNE